MRELNEMLSQSKVVGKIYGKIYDYTSYGVQVLEFMEEHLEENEKLDLFNEWLMNGEFKLNTYSYDDIQELIQNLDDVLVELQHQYWN